MQKVLVALYNVMLRNKCHLDSVTAEIMETEVNGGTVYEGVVYVVSMHCGLPGLNYQDRCRPHKRRFSHTRD